MNKVTVSLPQNITSPPGNSLALYIDALTRVAMLKDIYGVVEPLSNYVSGGGGGISVTSVTYAEATTLVNANGLTPYGLYLINDFQTIYDQPDYDVNGDPKPEVATLEGSISPILIQAASDNTFFGWALQPEYPSDKLQYDFTFSQTEVMGAPAKGRISERIDTNNNRTFYDHRVVLFKRYANPDDGNLYTSYKDNGEASDNFLTFVDECFDNYLMDSLNSDGFLLSNNVFDTADSSSFDSDFYNNTFGICINTTIGSSSFGNIIRSCTSNTIAVQFQNNYVFGFMYDNVINGLCKNNTFQNMDYNKIGGSFMGNTGANFSSNTIGEEFMNNTITGTFNYNVIATFCSDNNFNGSDESGTEGNTIGQSFTQNTTGVNFQFNTIGHAVTGNTIGASFERNSIGDSFENNQVADDFYDNVIGNGCSGNEWQQPFYGNRIETFFTNNTITAESGVNIIANFCDNNTFTEFYGCTIGESCSSNTFLSMEYNIMGQGFQNNICGTAFRNNTIGDGFTGNTFGTSFLFNNIRSGFANNASIGNNFQYNTIVDNFVTNTIGDNFQNNVVNQDVQGCTITNNFRNNSIFTPLNAVNFTGATHVYATYTCNIILNSASANRLTYFLADVLTVVDITT